MLKKYSKMVALLLLLLLHAAPTASSTKPNIVFLLADDLGWANVGWHAAASQSPTPVLDALVTNGVQLDRHYAFKFCSPSRCALQSGRNPIHVNVVNGDPTWSVVQTRIGCTYYFHHLP